MPRSPRSFANYPKRFKPRLEAVAKARMEREGRPCPVSHLLTICITKQLPALESAEGIKT